MISPLLSTLLTCTNTLVYLCILGILLRLLIYLEIILTIMTSQECHFSSLALQRGRENEAMVTLNRGRDMPQLGLRRSQARGHPKAQPPSHLGAVEINPTCVHAAALMTFHSTTCKYSRDSSTSRESFAARPAQGHLQDSCAFLCSPSLFFKPSWRCLPSPSHALAGMLNADETILDPSSSTYFRAINLAS